jgi:polyphenol oxidase
VTGSGARLSLRERRVGELAWFECRSKEWALVFGTRTGGVSPAPYDSLNIGFSAGDEPDRVVGNRKRLLDAVGLPADRVVVPRQVHGTQITEVDDAQCGRGVIHSDDSVPATDGLVTSARRVGLWVSFADCVPVFVAATDGDITTIALVHAGWRGMADGIVGKAAQRLAAHGRLSAAVVGPSIGPCHFEVSDEIAGRFEGLWPGVTVERRVDLWECAVRQLEAVGLGRTEVLVSRLCTVCDARFFSHRRDNGLTGRQAAIAWVTARGGDDVKESS